VTSNCAIDLSRACERAAMVNKCVACNGAIELQHATLDIGVAGVGIGSRQLERSRTDLGQRTTAAAIHPTILDHAGKSGA